MPFATPHMLMQWTATFKDSTSPSGNDIELVVGSLRYGGPGVAAADKDAVLDAAVPYLQALWQDQFIAIPANCFLKTVKWNQVGTDGRYVSDGATRQADITPTPGSTAGRYPFQVAWATTWVTDFNRGPAHAGRTYWPTAIGVSPLNGTVTPGEARDCATAAWSRVVAMTAAIQTAAGGTVVPMICSNVGAGKNGVIRGAKVGTRLDIQRRRGGGIKETYEADQVA